MSRPTMTATALRVYAAELNLMVAKIEAFHGRVVPDARECMRQVASYLEIARDELTEAALRSPVREAA